MIVEAQETYSTQSEQVLKALKSNGWMSPEEVRLAEQTYEATLRKLEATETDARKCRMSLRWLYSAVTDENVSLSEALDVAKKILEERK